LTEYTLHTENGISYQMQGYVLPDGTIPARKVDEHILVRNLIERNRPKSKR
jgi:hypothetical protein